MWGTRGSPTFELHDAPNRFVDTCDARVLTPEDFLSLRGGLVNCGKMGEVRHIPTSFWKNVSQMVTPKQTKLQKRRYVLRDNSGMPHFSLGHRPVINEKVGMETVVAETYLNASLLSAKNTVNEAK